jgi:hypothetical protein
VGVATASAATMRAPEGRDRHSECPAIIDSFIAVPETSGLGLEVRPKTLEKYGVKI